MCSTYYITGDGDTAQGNVVTTEGYKSYGAQELDSMGLPAMLLEEAPNPATVAGELLALDLDCRMSKS